MLDTIARLSGGIAVRKHIKYHFANRKIVIPESPWTTLKP